MDGGYSNDSTLFFRPSIFCGFDQAKEDATELIQKVLAQLKLKEEKVVEVEKAKEEMEQRLAGIGNLVHDSVPVSNNEVSLLFGLCRGLCYLFSYTFSTCDNGWTVLLGR